MSFFSFNFEVYMKSKAQLASSILILATFIKSFKYPSNSFDIIFILVCAGIFLVYEFISDSKVKVQLDKLTVDTEDRFKLVDKEVRETKGYVSTMSLGNAFNRK